MLVQLAFSIRQLEDQAEFLRGMVREQPDNSLHNAQLATTLQHLDFVSPDGGSRIPEAEEAYL